MNYVYDENKTEGLALVGDESMNDVRYVPLAECAKLQRRKVPDTYLVNAHYAARCEPISLPADGQTLTVNRVERMRTGWRHGDHLP